MKERLYRLNFGWEAILILVAIVLAWNASHPINPEVAWKRICGYQKISEDAPVLSLPVNAKDVRYRYYGIFPFGTKENHPRGHPGIDFELKRGAEILAATPGTVAVINRNPRWINQYWVRIYYNYHYSLKYDHLGKVFVKTGEKVKRGQIIGKAAIWSRGPISMIHFEFDVKEKIYKGIYIRTAVCPGPYFSKEAKKELMKMVLRSKYHRLCYKSENTATR